MDANSVAMEVYKFDYYGRNLTVNDLAKDQWGYYKPGDPINIFHDQIKNDVIFYYETPQPSTPDPSLVTTVSNYIANTLPRDHVSVTPDFFSLKKITYPTGGSSEFVYESNRFKDLTNTEKWGGGLRIKEIKSSDLVNQVALHKRYSYGVNEDGMGKSQVPLNYRFFANETIHFSAASSQLGVEQNVIPLRTLTYSTSPGGDVDINGFLGSAVIYQEVHETTISSQGENRGFIKYVYDLGPERYEAVPFNKGVAVSPNGPPCHVFNWNGYSPLYVRRYSTWRKPYLIEKSFYEWKNNTYRTIRKEEYIQHPDQLFTVAGFKVKPFASSPNYDPNVYTYYNHIGSFFDYDSYTIEAGRMQLYEKKTTTYTPTDSKRFRYTHIAEVRHLVPAMLKACWN